VFIGISGAPRVAPSNDFEKYHKLVIWFTMPPKDIRTFFSAGKAASAGASAETEKSSDSDSVRGRGSTAVVSESPAKKTKSLDSSPKKYVASASLDVDITQSKSTGKRKTNASKRKAAEVDSSLGKASDVSPGDAIEEDPHLGASDHPKKSGAFVIPAGSVPDIGAVVMAKVKDKWYTAHLVKHERFGITQLYAVKGLTVIFDRDVPKPKATYDMGSPDILLTGETRTVRYWSSGTPCMRATNVDAFAVPTAEAQAAAALTKTKKHTGPVKYAGPAGVKAAMAKADALAAQLMADLEGSSDATPTTEQMEAVFGAIGPNWPTQDRPNVTPVAGKPVTGFCLGAVYVLGGVGMATSNVSLAFPALTKCITAWVRGSLPDKDFPFSSIQINYNYMARKHVDGNNIGPSYIIAIGPHAGGGLWTADQYVHSVDATDGSAVVKSGGGPTVLDAKGEWKLFNGNAEHATEDVGPLPGRSDYMRVSVIVFSNSSYNKLPSYTVEEMKDLGFTAQSSNGEDLPYFKRYRIDKKEFSSDQNKTYVGYLISRAKKQPPPPISGRVCIECFGLTMNRGGGWMSYGGPTPEKPAEADSSLAQVVELEPNRTGFHVLALKLDPVTQGLMLVSSHVNKNRFDIYKDEVKETARFAKFVQGLPDGCVVLITITDTAIAAKRPPGRELYAALEALGGSPTMERIGYRLPFAFIGVKGAAPGTANQAMDKTKILLRIEATAASGSANAAKDAKRNGIGAVVLSECTLERTDIAELMLTEDGGPPPTNLGAAGKEYQLDANIYS